MSLKSYERSVSLDTIYETSKMGGVSGSETLTPYISVKGGSVDIHAITSATVPTAIEDFELVDADTAISGTKTVETAIRYIVVVQNEGTSSEILLSGIEIKEVGTL